MEEHCVVLLCETIDYHGLGSAASFKHTLMFQQIINHSKDRHPSPLFLENAATILP